MPNKYLSEYLLMILLSCVLSYLVGVDDDLALLLVRAGDDEHVVEAGGVVNEALVLVGGQNIASPRLQQMNSSLVHSQPEVLGPVGGKGLLQSGY